MAAVAKPLVPRFDLPQGATQISVVVNENYLRDEVQALPALSQEATQPGSPAEGALYILSAAWGDEVTGTLAYYRDSAWTYWVPFEGMRKYIGATEFEYSSGTWS